MSTETIFLKNLVESRWIIIAYDDYKQGNAMCICFHFLCLKLAINNSHFLHITCSKEFMRLLFQMDTCSCGIQFGLFLFVCFVSWLLNTFFKGSWFVFPSLQMVLNSLPNICLSRVKCLCWSQIWAGQKWKEPIPISSPRCPCLFRIESIWSLPSWVYAWKQIS